MWNWFSDKRRKKLQATPFPGLWEEYIQKNIPYYRYLNDDEKKRLQNLVRVFIEEKHWLGCNGLELTHEIRVTIAAHACLLILELPNNCYPNVESIYVYPSTFTAPEDRLGFHEVRTTPVSGPRELLGEAHHQGPIILAWDTVKRETRHPEHGHNLVYHEFAHKLDMLDGSADGTPPLASSENYQRWHEVCSRVYLELCDKVEDDRPTFLDSYAATDEAEFFAVATEHFFSQPADLQHHQPELFQVSKDFYRQDPARKAMKRLD